MRLPWEVDIQVGGVPVAGRGVGGRPAACVGQAVIVVVVVIVAASPARPPDLPHPPSLEPSGSASSTGTTQAMA